MLKTGQDVVDAIQSDKERMAILYSAQALDLPDWWIAAGFVRSKIWDVQHGFTLATPLSDVDVIYFDQTDTRETKEKQWETRLQAIHQAVPWSVKNQARMHKVNQLSPYEDSIDAISTFPETATALGVKLDRYGQVVLTAPWGVDDALNMIVRPTPLYNETSDRNRIYQQRVAKKKWQSVWKEIHIVR